MNYLQNLHNVRWHSRFPPAQITKHILMHIVPLVFFFIFCSNLLSFSPVISISAFYCLSHVLQGQYNQDGAQCYTRVVKSCTSTVKHAGSTKATQFQYSYWTAPAITCHQIEMFSSEDRDSKMIFFWGTLPWFQWLHPQHQRLQCRRMTRGKKITPTQLSLKNWFLFKNEKKQ